MNLTADTAAITATAQTLTRAAEALSADVDSLAAASSDLRGRWAGDAQSAFTSQHAQVDARMREKAAILKITGQRLATYAADLERADIDGARAVLGL
ncbi:WXG100 family type VII secretion target [uncultured Microbacterium sp.]|uniref:WXG100 family type VII secretion target n=1 Tax=uncultured Microbacterium sp. TaxID=191216 RepID=UPI0025FBE37C|nr:WXG100 family type VII secretion target [uncultured Microbacterium sp.]